MKTTRPWTIACLAAISLAGAAALGTGCADDAVPSPYTTCRCETEFCGPSTCSFKILLHDNCQDDVKFAEVLIDDHVEEQLVEFGDEITPCTRIAPGTTSTVWIRGGSWIWGPLERDCDGSGKVHRLELKCSEG